MILHQGEAEMDLRYWKQFESSGRVEDYLAFAARNTQERNEEAKRVEEDGHAGTYNGDGNCAENLSGGGIR